MTSARQRQNKSGGIVRRPPGLLDSGLCWASAVLGLERPLCCSGVHTVLWWSLVSRHLLVVSCWLLVACCLVAGCRGASRAGHACRVSMSAAVVLVTSLCPALHTGLLCCGDYRPQRPTGGPVHTRCPTKPDQTTSPRRPHSDRLTASID